MRGGRSIRYYPRFPEAIPVRGAGCPRVTQPFATLFTPEGVLIVRLACVRRAASVHPEPGSNSPFGSARGDKPPPFPNVVASVRRSRHHADLDSLGVTLRRGSSKLTLIPKYTLSCFPAARLAAGRGALYSRLCAFPHSIRFSGFSAARRPWGPSVRRGKYLYAPPPPFARAAGGLHRPYTFGTGGGATAGPRKGH